MKVKYIAATIGISLCILLVIFITIKRHERISEQPSGVPSTITEQKKTLKNNVAPVPADIPRAIKQESPGKPLAIREKTTHVEKTSTASDPITSFNNWLDNYLSADHTGSRDLLEEGIALAKTRKQVMTRLIQTDPEAALAKALSYYDYEQLPDELQVQVEQPFTDRVNVVIMPDHTGSGKGPTAYLETRKGGYQARQLFLYGQRQNIPSKNGIGAQGIILDNMAAVDDKALQSVTVAEDLAWTGENLLVANKDLTKDYFTGEPITSVPVVAVAGGRTFYFADEKNVRLLNGKLAEMENRIGPELGSQVLFADVMASDEGADSLSIILSQEAPVAASAWTETKKTVFMIRVDFPDLPGESAGKLALQNRLNGNVTDYIEEYSYGKTWIEGEVSDAVVTVPQVSSSYLPDKYFDLLNDAKTAFNALGTGIELSDYDIVGVHFAQIGYTWGGLASIGVGNIWLQNTLSASVIVHEFGHNYGLYHASFWDTDGASVVGVGESEEYGDIFDRMGSGSLDGHFHMQGKARLNWLTDSQWEDIVDNGSYSYRVYRFDHSDAAGSNRQALRIYKSTGQYYWLGYRRNLPGKSWLQNGAYVVWQRNSSQSWLIDTTPGSAAGKDDAGIVIGRTYSDTGAGVHITPIAKGGTTPDEWLDVRINIGDFSSNNEPTVAIIEPALLMVRTPLEFTADASDLDGDELAYSWDFGDGMLYESVAAMSHSWVVGGTYTVTVTVSDMKGGIATDQVIVTVDDPLSNWQARTSNTTEDLFDIATDGTQVMAVGEREVVVSIDGADWSSLGAVGTNVYLYAITHDGSQWIGVGMDWTGSWSGAIYTSPYGSTWTNQYIGGPKLRDIATNGAVNVAVGDGGTILRSTDGITWTSQTSGTATPILGVAWGDGMFVAVGSVSSGGSVLVLTSPDGINWTDHSSGAGLANWQGFDDVEYLDDQFLASGWYSKIRCSDDSGSTFFTMRSSTEEIPAFAYGNAVYFAAGIDKDNSSADIDLASMDGVNWYELPTPSLDDRNSALFFNNTFITVGDEGAIRQSDPIPLPSGSIGDVNNDSIVNLADSIMSLQILVNITPAGTPTLDADVNGDNRIGFAEAIFALQAAAGLTPK